MTEIIVKDHFTVWYYLKGTVTHIKHKIDDKNTVWLVVEPYTVYNNSININDWKKNYEDNIFYRITDYKNAKEMVDIYLQYRDNPRMYCLDIKVSDIKIICRTEKHRITDTEINE